MLAGVSDKNREKNSNIKELNVDKYVQGLGRTGARKG